MPIMLENIGFGVVESQEVIADTLSLVCENGKKFPVAGGAYFCWHDDSGAEIWVRMQDDQEDTAILGCDTHFAGKSTWNTRILNILAHEQQDRMEGIFMMTPVGKETPFIAYIVDSLLHSQLADDVNVKLQMTASPYVIELFENEEIYKQKQKENGLENSLPLGSIFPIGLYSQYGIYEEGKEPAFYKQYPIDTVFIVAKVIAADVKQITWNGQEHYGAFLHLIVATPNGNLDVVVNPLDYEKWDIQGITTETVVRMSCILTAKVVK